MKKIILATKTNDWAGLMWQLLHDGRDCELVIMDNYYRNSYKNICNRRIVPTNFSKLSPRQKGDIIIGKNTPNNSVIVFDMNGEGLTAEYIKSRGFGILGAGMGITKSQESIGDLLEHNRQYAFNVCEQLDIDCGEWHYFKNTKEAIKFLSNTDKEWVCKPCGKMATSLTFVSHDNKELSQYLENVGDMIKEGIILQERIEGTELSTEVFVSNGKFVKGSFNHTLETKKFMPSNKSENTGCASSLVWFTDDNSNIIKQSLSKIEELIGKTKYCGFFDMNGIIDDEGIWHWLENTDRAGFSAVYAMSVLLKKSIGYIIEDIAEGKLESLETLEGFGSAIRLTVPPAPFEADKEPPLDFPDNIRKALMSLKNISKDCYFSDYEELVNRIVNNKSKNQVVDFDYKDKNYIPLNIYYNEEKKNLQTTGDDPIIMEVLGYGDTIESTFKESMKRAESVEIANVQFRDDAKENATKRYDELKKKGIV